MKKTGEVPGLKLNNPMDCGGRIGELEDILGPGELFGGSIRKAVFDAKVEYGGGGTEATVAGTLYVLCDGDFDSEDAPNEQRWLKFRADSLEFHYDGDEGWTEPGVIWFSRDACGRIARLLRGDIYDHYIAA